MLKTRGLHELRVPYSTYTNVKRSCKVATNFTIMSSVLEQCRDLMQNLKGPPGPNDRVYKEECLLSCDTPFSPNGLYVNLTTWQAFGFDLISLDSAVEKSIYLNIKQEKVEKPAADDQPTKLAIGKEGGFLDQFDIITTYALYLPKYKSTLALPCSDLPDMIQLVIDGIINHSGVNTADQAQEWEEQLVESKHSNDLVQVPITGNISANPATWKCMACDVTEHLWLNLSDGYIGCGRKNWDGSGGCGASLVHYEETGKQYHLAVKLGTITPTDADVFSYAENDMVKNKNLAKHLLHFGVNLENMKKTEKSMNELQIELNQNFEFDKITEAGKDLTPLNGKGYIGFTNIGNSCYMNSVLQVLLAIPAIADKYNQAELLQTHENEIANDFTTQMAKLAIATGTDRYTGSNAIDIKPKMFKNLVGKNHPEFKTGHQQDAMEYFQHLMEFMHRKERTSRIEGIDSNALFQFQFEDRIQCNQSNRVKSLTRKDMMLSLTIPVTVESALKKPKLETPPTIPFTACLENAFADETIQDFMSSVTNTKGTALKRIRFQTFPAVLVIQLKRYYVAEDWTPKKLDVLVPVPETLSLEKYRSTGLAAGEEELSDVDSTANTIEPSVELVNQLINMGFSENGSKRAAIATNNASTEVAMEWVFAHMADSNFNDPVTTASSNSSVNQEHVQMLVSMGFTSQQAEKALNATDGVPDRAVEWLFSHAGDSMDTDTNATDNTDATGAKGEYELFAFISHVGSNTACGHYVCHIKKEGRWAIFNDDKVAVSDTPPFDLGYMYFFQRKRV